MKKIINANVLMTVFVIVVNLWTMSQPGAPFFIKLFCLFLIVASAAVTWLIIQRKHHKIPKTGGR